MAVTIAYASGTVTNAAVGTENTLGSDPITDDGVFVLWVDLSAMNGGDEVELAIYEKVASAGTQRLVKKFSFADAQNEPHFTSPGFVLGHGWKMTLKLVAGAGTEDFDWRVDRIA